MTVEPLDGIRKFFSGLVLRCSAFACSIAYVMSSLAVAIAIITLPFESIKSFHFEVLNWACVGYLIAGIGMLAGALYPNMVSYRNSEGARVFPITKESRMLEFWLYAKIFIGMSIAALFVVKSGLTFSSPGKALFTGFILSLPTIVGLLSGNYLGVKEEVVTEEELARYYGNEYHEQSRARSDDSSQVKTFTIENSAPRFSFQNVHGYADLKKRLLEAATPVLKTKGESSESRNGILLSGDPGNGKTFIAEALAGELKVKFLVMDYSKVVSQWVGETPKNIAAVFSQAKTLGPCVLFIDEIDSFIINRDGTGSQTAESANIVNVLLTELVNIRRYPVVVVAATNRLNKLDPAAIREGRFDFKIEVPNPDEEARIGLLLSSLRKHAKGAALDEAAVRSAAQRWNGFSVKRIMAVGEEMPAYLREHPAATVGYEQLTGALRRIQGRKGKLPADTKPLEALVLPDQTRNAVELVASRIADPMRIERLGGTLPSGVLFYGPAGTGKTAVARALAKKTGWAFISVAGPDLLRDLDQLDKLYTEAKELRPVLVFIDEADDILRERGMSNASAVTNKLLTIMDGADGKVKDVVFIAATNNPDQIDPAMLRAGRFTEKVPFFAADEQSASTLVKHWFAARPNVRLGAGVSPAVVGRMLDGQSPANIEGVLQYGLNLAISESSGDDVALTLDHIGRAIEVVVPA